MMDELECSARELGQDGAVRSLASAIGRHRTRHRRVIFLAWLLAITACANNYHAPIEQKSALPSPSRPTAQATARAAASALAERERPTPAVHVVASGDKLLTIAWRYGLDVRDLIRWNQITNPDLIVIGQPLRLRPVTPPPVISARASGASTPAPMATTPSASDAPGREMTAATSVPSRAGPITSPAPLPPNAAAAAPASGGASTNRPVAELPSSPATSPVGDNNRTIASEALAASKEGVRWVWPTQGKISVADNGAASKGIDIRGARGQAVKSAAAGAVVYSGSGLRGYGELIIIKHSDTFLSAYAHNEVRLVQEGRRVAAGESIARMGNTDTTDVMLHFEIRRNGKSIDPLQYLPKR